LKDKLLVTPTPLLLHRAHLCGLSTTRTSSYINIQSEHLSSCLQRPPAITRAVRSTLQARRFGFKKIITNRDLPNTKRERKKRKKKKDNYHWATTYSACFLSTAGTRITGRDPSVPDGPICKMSVSGPTGRCETFFTISHVPCGERLTCVIPIAGRVTVGAGGGRGGSVGVIT